MTVLEVENKKIALETEMAVALEAAKVLTPATPEFDDAYSRYLKAKSDVAKIPEEISKAKIAENADAIKVAAGQVAEAIGQLVEGLKVADLTGTPITALRYFTDAEGKTSVVFNPVTKIASKGTSSKTPGTGRTTVIDPEGNSQSLTKFVLAHATDEEKASDAYKYPHSQVATKPKFEAFCEAHTLTGYTYQTSSDAPAPDAPVETPAS